MQISDLYNKKKKSLAKNKKISNTIFLQTSRLLRRQLFLQRNIRRFKSKHSIIKSTTAGTTTISKLTDLASTTTTSSLSSLTITKTQQKHQDGDNNDDHDDKSHSRISMENMSTTSTTKTTSTTVNTTTSSSTIQTTNVGSLNTISGGSSSSSSINPIENNQFWFRKPPERIGSCVNDGYYVNDDADIKLNPNSYKRVYVAKNNDVVFYKLNSLRRAKEVSIFL